MGRDPALQGRYTKQEVTVLPPAEPPEETRNGFRVGDPVWVRRRGPPTRCTDVSRQGTVTRVVSEQLVEVNGVPWHVRCLRRRRVSDQAPRDSAGGDGDDPAPLLGGSSQNDDGPAPLLRDPQSDEEWHDAESGDTGLFESALNTAPVQSAPDVTPSELRASSRARQPPNWYGTVVANNLR